MSRKQLVRIAAGLVLLWLASGFVVSWRLSRRLTTRFEEGPPPDWALERGVEDIVLETVDGERLLAWYLPPSKAEHPSVLFLHGLTGTRRFHAPLMRRLSDRGLGCLSITMRAHGGSSGDIQDYGFGSRHDVGAAVAFLEERRPDAPILVVGSSLGAAAAIYGAPALEERVDAYVLEAPYLSLSRAAFVRCQLFLVPGLDRLAYGSLRVAMPLFLEPSLEELRPIDVLERIPATVPLWFVSGTADRRAPTNDVKRMVERCPGPVELELVEGGAHALLTWQDTARFEGIVMRALASCGHAAPIGE